MLVTVINLTQAARAGAIAAAADYASGDTVAQQTSDAHTASYDEQGGAGSISCTPSSKVPSGCVGVSDGTGTEFPSQRLAVVTLWETVHPFIPLFPGITVTGTATAAAGS